MAQHLRPHHVHDDVEERIDALLDLLRGEGGRITTGRRAVVRALITATDHHVTADDVARLVQDAHPDVHLSTVYRTLDALEQLGAVARLNLGTGPAVYHLRGDHAHHHFVCDTCGTVVQLDAAAVAPLLDSLAGVGTPGQVTISGRCRSCS